MLEKKITNLKSKIVKCNKCIRLVKFRKKIAKENQFKDYKVFENLEKKQSLFDRIFFKLNSYKDNIILKSELCTQLKTNLVSIYSFQSAGC